MLFINCGPRPPLGSVASLFLALVFLSSPAFTQAPVPETVPPPLRLLSIGEKDQLEAKKGLKDRTKLALDLMAERIANAGAMHAEENYDEVFTELGRFHALMDYTLDFLQDNDRGRGKDLGNFKRFEMGIRKFVPSLELIRREIPPAYEPYVNKLINYVRDARSEAIEPFFGESVLPKRVN